MTYSIQCVSLKTCHARRRTVAFRSDKHAFGVLLIIMHAAWSDKHTNRRCPARPRCRFDFCLCSPREMHRRRTLRAFCGTREHCFVFDLLTTTKQSSDRVIRPKNTICEPKTRSVRNGYVTTNVLHGTARF